MLFEFDHIAVDGEVGIYTVCANCTVRLVTVQVPCSTRSCVYGAMMVYAQGVQSCVGTLNSLLCCRHIHVMMRSW